MSCLLCLWVFLVFNFCNLEIENISEMAGKWWLSFFFCCCQHSLSYYYFLFLFFVLFFFTIQFKLAYSHPAVVLKTNISFQRLYDIVYLPLNYRLCLAICKLIWEEVYKHRENFSVYTNIHCSWAPFVRSCCVSTWTTRVAIFLLNLFTMRIK